MKILNIHKTITVDQLLKIIKQKLNRLFKEQRQTEILFTVENKNGIIEISQPDLYNGFLFRIEIKGTQLLVTRDADYIDDVNALTVESILNALFAEIAGEGGVTFVLEG